MNPEIYDKIRLKPFELDAIVRVFKEVFSKNDQLWIFGSRVNLNARGGDIDLYVETEIHDAKEIYTKREKLVIALWHIIGEQRIDVVVKSVNDNFEIPIYNVARQNGVKLV